MVTALLLRLVEVSHWFSLLAVLAGLSVSLLVIVRFLSADLLAPGGVTRVSKAPAAQMAVVRAPLPVAVALGDNSRCDRNGLELRLSQSPSWKLNSVRLRLFAGVSVSALHHALRAPWPWLLDVFHRGGNPFGADGCQEAGREVIVDLSESPAEVTVTRESDRPLELGGTPRRVYPFVLMCVPGAEADLAAPENGGRIGAVLCVVHVKDTECAVPTQILFTHLKHLEGGRSTTLTPIYVSGAEAYEDSSEEDEAAAGSGSGNRCVVCQDLPVSRVIFPCRHACTCGRCFPKLRNRCPMCRTFIQSYFLLESEPESEPEDSAASAQTGSGGRNRTWGEWLEEFNHNFAMRMGLQENE